MKKKKNQRYITNQFWLVVYVGSVPGGYQWQYNFFIHTYSVWSLGLCRSKQTWYPGTIWRKKTGWHSWSADTQQLTVVRSFFDQLNRLNHFSQHTWHYVTVHYTTVQWLKNTARQYYNCIQFSQVTLQLSSATVCIMLFTDGVMGEVQGDSARINVWAIYLAKSNLGSGSSSSYCAHLDMAKLLAFI